MANKQKIDKNSAKPFYQQLMDKLVIHIKENLNSPSAALPSEREMCRIFNVSHTTVRLALKELEISGMVIRIPGKGTFISDKTRADAGQKKFIGIIFENISGNDNNDFRMQLINGIRMEINQYQIGMILFEENDSSIVSLAQSGKLCGLILTNPMTGPYRLRELQQYNLPLVSIGRPPGRGIEWVDNNNVEVGYAITGHLLKTGRRRIGFIGADREFTLTKDRLAGYKKALKEYGIAASRGRIGFYPSDNRDLNHLIAQILQDDTDAIVCIDDLTAMSVLQYLHQNHVECPRQVAITGCNDSNYSHLAIPPLSSVNIHVEQIGSLAARRLLDRTADDFNNIVDFELKIRESSHR